MEEIDFLVVGGGIIGLAVARQAALRGHEVVLVEAEATLGSHTSSRNSEVIHAGIYYPPGSLKAALCVEGKVQLYEYLAANDVPHRRIGKLIVASSEQEVSALSGIVGQAHANGVHDLTRLDASEVRELEPQVMGVAGLFSPSTGIVDSHALMTAFRRDAVGAGALVLCQTEFLSARVDERGILVQTAGPDSTTILCKRVVNAGGLRAPEIASRIDGLSREFVPTAYFAKGHYFTLAGRAPFRHLVYPIPEPGGLGVHVTLDMAGQVRFGPDVCWVEGVDYTFDAGREESFYQAIRRYFPGLEPGSLVPGYTGVRPKLGPKTTKFSDFVIQGPSQHGVPGLVNLFGIESPGLTASLAIADHVGRLL